MATGVMGQEQKFKSRCHMATFLTWDLDPRVRNRIEATCFKYFLSIPKTVQRLNMKLITALAKFYDLDKKAFAFGEGERRFYVDIGLEDILYSTGLPIDGLQVSGFEDKNPLVTIQANLNVSEEVARSLLYKKKGQVPLAVDLKTLQSRFEKVPDDAIDLIPYQKAYLFFLVGSLLFSRTTESISPMYLPLLGESVNNYAWGAATFAFIKQGLVSMREGLTNGKTKNVPGFGYALMIFAVERFPCLHNLLCIDSLPSGFPLLSGWLNLFPKGNDKKIDVNHFQNKLETMTEDQVTWQPYKPFDRNLELPDEYKDHMYMIYSCTACICFNVVAYNCPHMFFKQLGLATVCMPSEMPDMRRHPKLSISKNKGKDWRKIGLYAEVNEYWDKRRNYVVKAEEMNFGSQSSSLPAGDQSIRGTCGIEASNNDHVDGENEGAETEFDVRHSSISVSDRGSRSSEQTSIVENEIYIPFELSGSFEQIHNDRNQVDGENEGAESEFDERHSISVSDRGSRSSEQIHIVEKETYISEELAGSFERIHNDRNQVDGENEEEGVSAEEAPVAEVARLDGYQSISGADRAEACNNDQVGNTRYNLRAQCNLVTPAYFADYTGFVRHCKKTERGRRLRPHN